jgi:cytochrome P450
MFTMTMGGESRPPVTPLTLLFAARLIWKSKLNPFTMQNSLSLIASDGVRHDTLRAVVNRGFTPRRIEAWRTRAEEVVADCMREIESSPEVDLVSALAVPLPVTLIAEILGIEPERRADFKRWSNLFLELIDRAGRREPFTAPLMNGFCDFAEYLTRMARARREKPADDLISLLVAPGASEMPLGPADVLQFVALLLVAGNETTTNLIGNAANALLDHPDQLARVAADPALVPDLVEEAVRFESPVATVFRTATEDVEIAGGRIEKGATVALLIGSANRDERRFPDPDRFDLGRDTRGHLGFGFGTHFCLGASLARLEAATALRALVPSLTALKRRGPVQPVESFLVRGPARLPLQRAA